MDSQEVVRRISHYSSDMDILLVGEGDFSFATALARAFQFAPRLLATSLDSQETLLMNYGALKMAITLAELSVRQAVVMNGVDVKSIVIHPSFRHRSFDRIVYNFPHSGFVFGLDERDTSLIRKHRQLMRSFFKNVRRILKEGGEVHVAHHMCMPYSEWRLEEEAAKSGFKLQAWHKFEAQDFPGYTPRRGAGANANGTFPLRNPVTFIFVIPRPSPSPYINIRSSPPPPPLCIDIHLAPPPSLPYGTEWSPSITTSARRLPISLSPPPSHVPHCSHAISSSMSSQCPFPSPPAITPSKPSTIVSPSPLPPSPSPVNISTHCNNYSSINSHRKPHNPPPSPFKTSSDVECSQPSSSNQYKPFSWISALTQVINFFMDLTKNEG